MSYKIICTHEYSDLSGMQQEWETLQANSKTQSVFLCWEWVVAYWRHFGSAEELWLLRAYDENQHLVGIAPLLRRAREWGGLRWYSLEFIGELWGSPHLDFIIEEGLEEPVMRAFLAWLSEHRAWSEIRLLGLPAESSTHTILQNSRGRWKTLKVHPDPFLALPDSWDTYFASLSGNKRSRQRRFRRKLDEQFPGHWSIERLEDPQAVHQAMDHLIAWHQEKWTGRHKLGTFHTEADQAFHHEIAQRFLKRGWLWLYRLTVNGETVCATYIVSFMNRLYGIANGTDPAYLEYSPNSVLIEDVLRQAIEDHLIELDFLWGEHEYKMRWGATSRQDLVLSNPIGLKPFVYDEATLLGRSLWHKVKRRLPDNLRQQVGHKLRSIWYSH